MNKQLKPWIELQPQNKEDDEIFSMRSIRFDVPNGGGLPYEANAINIVVGKDGHIHFFSDDVESHIYFYPNQVKHLKKAIAAHNKRAK